MDKFESDLKDSELCTTPAPDIDDLVTQYNKTLSLLLDKHAPVVSTTQSQERKTPWYTQDIHIARQERRKLTRKWRKSRSQKDKECMITQRNKVGNMIDEAKRDYYQIAITKAGKNSQILFRTFRQLLNDNKINPMPPGRTSLQNANDFNQFFIEKIERLKARFHNKCDYSYLDGEGIKHSMTEYKPIPLEKAERLILSAPSKTCALDPVPTRVLTLALF